MMNIRTFFIFHSIKQGLNIKTFFRVSNMLLTDFIRRQTSPHDSDGCWAFFIFDSSDETKIQWMVICNWPWIFLQVASWGAYLLSRNILTVSFAPRDTHEAQVQFALERGVPALIGVMASIRLPYPSRAFDMAHCSRCLIPWGQYGNKFLWIFLIFWILFVSFSVGGLSLIYGCWAGGLYLIEIDRILRPGGYWILSGPPVNWKKHWKGWNRTAEDLNNEQSGIEAVAKSLCWKKLVEKDDLAVWQKPTNHAHCQINRKVYKKPPFCEGKDPDQAW